MANARSRMLLHDTVMIQVDDGGPRSTSVTSRYTRLISGPDHNNVPHLLVSGARAHVNLEAASVLVRGNDLTPRTLAAWASHEAAYSISKVI